MKQSVKKSLIIAKNLLNEGMISGASFNLREALNRFFEEKPDYTKRNELLTKLGKVDKISSIGRSEKVLILKEIIEFLEKQSI